MSAFASYMAGVADSDGSFSISLRNLNRRSPNYTALFQLTWTSGPLSEAVFDKLVATYGGSYCRVNSSAFQIMPNSRPCLKYCLTGASLERFILDVLPFLLLKRKQARNILRLRKVRSPVGVKTAKDPRIQNFEHRLFILNKSLNTKNGTVHASY